MHCPYCREAETRVIDSRLAEDGAAIRRRRECGACGRRFTTFERAEPAGLRVVKRSGDTEPYQRSKLVAGMVKALKNRPVGAEVVERIAEEIEQEIRAGGRDEVPSEALGMAVLDRLRELDEVAYLRFASVWKDFKELTDFEKELGMLLERRTSDRRILRD